jgi:O-Antigen ligase
MAVRVPGRLGSGVKTVLAILPALALATLAGIHSVGHPREALAGAAAIGIGAIFLLWMSRAETVAQRHRWIPLAWMALLLTTDLSFELGDPRAVATGQSLTGQHYFELLTYAIVATLVIRSRRALLSSYRGAVSKGLLLGWPLLAVGSTLWSPFPLFTFVRAMQLVVIASLALLMVRIWRTDPEAGDAVWVRTLTLFVNVVTFFAVIGFFFGAESETGARFTWPGVHPGLAAIYVGTALLILVAGGRSVTAFRRWSRLARIVLCVTALYSGQTRGVLVAVVIAFAATLWFRGREQPAIRYIGLAYYVVALGIVVIMAATPIVGYFSRGGGTEQLTSLNGRIALWGVAIDQLDSGGKWLTGFGYGASRDVLLPEVEWAGSAHSFWIEILLDLGIIGLMLALTGVALLGKELLTSPSPGASNVVALSLLVFLLMVSTVAEAVAFPGIGFGVLALLHVPSLSQRSLRTSARHPESSSLDASNPVE